MRIFILLFITFSITAQDIVWTHNSPIIRTFSSIRTTDLNNDNIDDIIIGGGVDGYPTPYGIIAVDGVSGDNLWNVTTRNEMFTTPQFFDYNNDNIDDIVIGGRDAELRLINGVNGDVIWEFWDENDGDPNDEGWYNFYTSQIIDDQTGDGVPDILTSNGGDHSLDFSETDRPPGHIMIIDGMTGELFKLAVVPDSNETYMSPIIYDLNQDSNLTIIFGTGGESVEGNLWITTLQDLLNEDITNATPLISNSSLGYIAPPSIADLNLDGVLDIITQGFDGKITVINGEDLNILWEYQLPNTESSASPIIGKFSDDDNLHVFATIFSGGMSSYNDYYQVLLNGNSGEVLWMDSLGLINFCTPIAFDSNMNGKDEVLISTINNNGTFFENELILIDFINQSTELFFGPIPGGNVASTPHITDLEDDGLLDILFSLQADSLDPFGNGTFYEDGVNIMRLTTNFILPESEIAWGGYMGNNCNGEYNAGCDGDLGLFAFPTEICPGENNGMINLYVSGGTPPYTYLWSNGATTEDLENLEPGLYTVTVTDNTGTCDVISREINEYNIISFHQTPSCNNGDDGMVYFNSSGCDCNTSFCQFIWELNGDTIANGDGSSAEETYKYLFNISAGTYTATIIHPDGCEIQQDIIVPNPEIIDSTFINPECFGDGGGFIELFNSPEDSLQNFLWNSGDTTQNIYNLSMGDYSVIISDTLCVDTLYFQIDNLEEMNGFILNDEYNILQSDTLFLNDSCYVDNTYSYGLGDTLTSFNNENTIWNLSGFEGTWTEENTECLNGDWCVIETEEDYYIYFNNSGIYNLSVYNNTNLENCTDNGDEIEIVVLEANCSNVSLNELNYNINVHGDILSINSKNPISNHHIKLFDSTGKLIITLKEKKNNISINTEKYVTGIYTLQITSNNNIYTEKIILNK